jgi:putative transposase
MINTREIAEEYRLSHWAQVMQERTQSGLSIKAFCRQAGICGNTYFYWQRKLREAACQELLPAANEGGANAVIPTGWAICKEVESETTQSNTVFIEIGKCRVSAGKDTNPELLEKVCKVLLRLC